MAQSERDPKRSPRRLTEAELFRGYGVPYPKVEYTALVPPFRLTRKVA